MSAQLPLALQLPDSASFENFHVVPRNREPVAALAAAVAEAGGETRVVARALHLCGAGGAGKTHLLYALCRRARAADTPALYLSLTDPQVHPEHIESPPGTGIVCIDDLHAAAGHPDWERALLMLFERARHAPLTLVTVARYTPSALGFTLKDLLSRAQRSVVYRLQPLDDAGKAAALRLRASQRGLDLSPEVVRYMLERYARDEKSLFHLLDRIDAESLAAKRRVTVPFLKTLED